MAIPAYSGILDGKTFVGKNGEIGKSDSEDDEIKFENGKFLSVGCAEYGFADADYTTKVDGDKVFFTTDIYSKKYGRITCSGMVKGNDLKATFAGAIKGNIQSLNRLNSGKGVDVGRRQEYFEQQGESLGGQGIHMLAAKSS
jgi:hypothetical protein